MAGDRLDLPEEERELLQETLDAVDSANGSIALAAESLGLHTSTVYRRLEKAALAGLRLRSAGTMDGNVKTRVLPIPAKGKVSRYILTSAQNNTRLNLGAWNNLIALAEHYDAWVMVGTYSYNKSAYGKKAVKRGTRRESDDDDLWYAPEVMPYLVDDRVELAPGLVWCGEMNILPTAVDPLSGLENYSGRASSIFPHAKVAMRSVASGKFEGTKFTYTTGTVTQKNYIQKKSGLKAEFHHVYGALIVEVDSDGDWFVRQLNADNDGTIYDLDLQVKAGVVTPGHRVKAINWGDTHTDEIDHVVRQTAYGAGGMLDVLRPEVQFQNDFMSFSTGRSHHDRRSPTKGFKAFVLGHDRIEDEVRRAAEFLSQEAYRDWCQTVVVDSNHDRHLARWIEEADYKEDHPNALFYLRTAVDWYEAMERQDDRFHLVSHVMRKHGARKDIRFLGVDESFIICPDKAGGIECGMHGDLGPNGARKGLAKYGRKANVGHTHSAEIRDGLYTAGTSSLLDLGYNSGPSSWSHSHIVTYRNGKRAIVTMWRGKWRA
jgi:hypothetical protein